MSVLTTPNQLTLFRLLLVPCLVICVLYGFNGMALAAFTVAGVTDALDGLLARRAAGILPECTRENGNGALCYYWFCDVVLQLHGSEISVGRSDGLCSPGIYGGIWVALHRPCCTAG